MQETWDEVQARHDATRQPFVDRMRRAATVEEMDDIRREAKGAGLRSDWILAEEYRKQYEAIRTIQEIMER